jgi:caa(3)-type oxidase subunit IV
MSDSHDVRKEVKIYIGIFVALAVLTVVTVGVSYVEWGVSLGVAVGLLIATVKAGLVAMFFMHLKAERAMIYWVLYLTVFFFFIMIALPLWHHADQLKLPSGAVAAEEGAAGATDPGTTKKHKEAETLPEITNVAGGAKTATVKGKVVFKGEAPRRRKMNMSGNKECAAFHGDSPPLTEQYVVGSEGQFANVMVYVSRGLEGQKFTPPSDVVKFIQQGCKYSPHVFGIQVGQGLEITNGDATLHNVHILPKKNREVNRSQAQKGDVFVQEFRRPEPKPIRIKCDVHPWMTAYAGIFEHPYFAVTGDDGTFELPKIAAGTYVLTAWHEAMEDVVHKTIEVADGEIKEVPAFEFEE